MIKGIITVWKNKWHILRGLWNTAFKTQSIEKISADRLAICAYCPDIDLEGESCLVPGTQPCCKFCGCSLHLKTRDLTSGCGNEKNPKWHPIETKNHGGIE